MSSEKCTSGIRQMSTTPADEIKIFFMQAPSHVTLVFRSSGIVKCPSFLLTGGPCSSDTRQALAGRPTDVCAWTVKGAHVRRTWCWSLPEAIEACIAMKPEDLPISFTRPTPLKALLASTCEVVGTPLKV